MTTSLLPIEIATRLKLVTAITDRVGSRVHYQELPQSSTYPHIWFTRTGVDNEPFLGGETGITDESFSLEIVSDTDESTLLDSVIETLENLDGNVGDGVVFMTQVEDQSDDYFFESDDGDADYRHALRITITHDGEM